MSEYETTELSVCQGCLILLANGEDPDGVVAGMTATWGEAAAHLTVGGEELGFSWSSCDGCESHLGGDRYRAYFLKPAGWL